MARELDAVQAERAGRSHIAPIPLVKLTVYSDQPAKTVAKIFYFSNMAVRYDYGNTGTDQDFTPVILGGSDFVSAFNHVPDPEDLTAFEQEFDLQLSNATINGQRLSVLLQVYNLEGASLEVSQLLVDRIDSFPVDLTAYVGDEHTVLFRGRVFRVSPITNAMLTVKCRTELPSLAGSWLYASDDTKTDPIDLGKRLPRVYGEAKRIPMINWEVGWLSTIIEDLTDSSTGTIEITDGTGLPSGTFTIRIDAEEVSCNTATATTLNIVARAQNGTTGVAHTAGALFSEVIATATYVVSDSTSNALRELYVTNPINGTLLRLDPTATPWTTNLSDTTTISGETITTVQFSAAQLSTLLAYFKAQDVASGGITTQPTFESLLDTVRVPMTAISISDPALEPVGLGGPGGSQAITQDQSPRMVVLHNATDSLVGGGLLWCPVGSAPNASRVVSRFRVLLTIDAAPHGSTNTTIRASYDFFGTNGSASLAMTGGAANSIGVVLSGGWETPSGSPVVGDLERSALPTSSTNQNFCSVFLDAAAVTSGGGGVNVFPDSCSVECELVEVSLTRTTDVVASAGASVGFGLRFFADVSGIEAAMLDPVYEVAEGFESGSWSVDNCTAALTAAQVDSGTNSLAVTWDADTQAGAVAFTTESLTGWLEEFCTVALVAGEGHREGSNAIEASATDAVNNATAIWSVDSFTIAEDFESGTWNANNGAAAINAVNPSTGSNSLEVTFDVDAFASIALASESISGWTTNSGNTLSAETGLGHTDGSGCLKCEATGTPTSSQLKSPTFSSWDVGTEASDGTGKQILVFDVYFDGNGDDWTIAGKGFGVDLYTGTSNRSWRFELESMVTGQWHTIICGSVAWWVSSGSFDPTNVNKARWWMTLDPPTGAFFAIDNIRLVAENTVVQNNVIGSVDMSSASDDYRINYYAGGTARLNPLNSLLHFPNLYREVNESDVWLSSDTWTGTTLGSNFWSWPADPADEPAAWQTIPWIGSFTVDGTFINTTVNSMRIAVKNLGGVYPRDPTLIHYFDTLSVNVPLTGPSGDMSLDLYNDNRDLLMFDFKIKKAGTTGSIDFAIGNDTDNYHHTLNDFDVSDFAEDTWVTMLLSIDQMTEVGTNVVADLNRFSVTFNQGTRSASCKVYLDNIKFVPQDCIVQNNAVGGSDFSSVDDLYRIAIYTDADNMIERNCWAWISSDTWGTTVLASNFRRFNFVPSATPDAFQTLTPASSFVDSGSPTLTAIASMRFTVRNSPGIYTRDPVNVHYIDTFEINNPESAYSVASGSVLVHPADIMLHWISEVGGEKAYGASVTALITALGASAEWGFDARSLGFQWEEVLQRMAFEARANVVPVEIVAGRRWKMLSADTTYGFAAPSASAVITQTHALTDDGRGVDDLASYFNFRYAFDASLPGGGNEEGYKLALIATPADSDVPITTTLISNASKRFGALDAGPIAFRTIQDPATAQDVAGYIVQERMANQRRVFRLEGVAWFDALPYDIGDIVSITAPWASAATTCRITSMSKAFSSHDWTIVAVEVLSPTGQHT